MKITGHAKRLRDTIKSMPEAKITDIRPGDFFFLARIRKNRAASKKTLWLSKCVSNYSRMPISHICIIGRNMTLVHPCHPETGVAAEMALSHPCLSQRRGFILRPPEDSAEEVLKSLERNISNNQISVKKIIISGISVMAAIASPIRSHSFLGPAITKLSRFKNNEITCSELAFDVLMEALPETSIHFFDSKIVSTARPMRKNLSWLVTPSDIFQASTLKSVGCIKL